MAILTDPPEWRVPGTKPPRNIIEELGWEVASHPPAPWFNWFFHRVFESLLELESATLARVVNEVGVPGIMAGPESDRPDSTPETEGRIYIATDTKRVFRDRGNGWDMLNTPEAIGAETPAGAQAKADAAAGAALSAAKAYADEAVAAHAGRTDNPHGVTKSQVGLGNVENYPVASQQEAEAGTASNRYMTPQRTAQAIAALAPVKSVAGRTGAVTLSKSDVGLGNVENYGIATQAEAEAGSVNNKYMTPQRTAQAIAALAPVKSVAGRTGAVTLSKSDVGLGNVENYGIATQAEAEAGTATNKYMTPLRVAQAIAALHANRRDNPHNVQAQQVPYSSGVSGFTPATVKAALDALAGVRIVEMGSNSNGTYVRWENGLQVVFGEATLGSISLSASGSVYASPDLTVTLPAVFRTGVYAWHVNSDSGLAFVWAGLGSLAQTVRGSITFRLFGGSALSNQNVVVSFFAIGRWQ